MPSTRQIIESALQENLLDEDRNPVCLTLRPGLTREEMDEFASSLPCPISDDIRDLLEFCSGLDGPLDPIDFTGRSLRSSFGLDSLLPYGLPIAPDGFGNVWAIDLEPESVEWGPVYYCCHDAPVMLLQSATVQEWVGEVVKLYIPPNNSLIDDVHEDRLFNVWGKNPGVIPHEKALASPDPDLRAFAGGLHPDFELIDLRDVPIGMGFSWGRYGPKTEVTRFGSKPIFAYRRPEKTSLLSRWFG